MSDSAPPPPPPEPPEPAGAAGPSGPTGAAPEPPPAPPPGQAPRGGMSGEQVTSALQTAHKFDLGIIACGVLMLIFSFLPYYTAELNGFGLSISDSASAWHGFFGWFGAVVALAVAVLVSLHIGGLRLSMPTRLVALVGFAISLVCVVLALFIIPGGDCNGIQACEDAIDFGHGIGYWLSVITVVIGLVLAFLRKDATD